MSENDVDPDWVTGRLLSRAPDVFAVVAVAGCINAGLGSDVVVFAPPAHSSQSGRRTGQTVKPIGARFQAARQGHAKRGYAFGQIV
ncbi:MAG: hypothetical protein ACJAVM_001748 [Sulfitobacter sp.]|jgi:hypothetical protein